MAEERVESKLYNSVELKLYNSMNNEKEIFNPKVAGKVSMYVCGVTAYDLSHLGHARAAVSFDILFRYHQSILNLFTNFQSFLSFLIGFCFQLHILVALI